MMALLAALYLLLRRTNVVSPGVNSPRELRCWAAAFLFSVAASHVWWYVLGILLLYGVMLGRTVCGWLFKAYPAGAFSSVTT